MQTATFYGASDDLIEIDGIKGGDEFNVYGSSTITASFVLGDPIRDLMRVYALYDRKGLWSFAVSKVDEDRSLPDWSIYTTEDPLVPYSMRLTIECPDDIRVYKEG